MKTNCTNCDKEIDRKPSYLARTKNPTCSKECRAEMFLKVTIQQLENDFNINLYDFLLEEYQVKQRTFRQIMKMLDITNNRNISSLLDYYNIPIRHGSEAIAPQWVNNEKRREGSRQNAKKHLNSKESRDKLRETMQTDNYKEKLRLANSGENNGMYGIKGESHHSWEGGKTKLKKYLRASINDWRQKHFQEANYQCDITGISKNLVVHHLDKSFHETRDEILDEMGINLDLNDTIDNLSEDVLNEICERIKTIHNDLRGIVLTQEVHTEFHKAYGYKNNNAEQYHEFKENYTKKLKETA